MRLKSLSSAVFLAMIFVSQSVFAEVTKSEAVIFDIHCELNIFLRSDRQVNKEYKAQYNGSTKKIINDTVSISDTRTQNVYVTFVSDYISIGIYSDGNMVYADSHINSPKNRIIAFLKTEYDPDIISKKLTCNYEKL